MNDNLMTVEVEMAVVPGSVRRVSRCYEMQTSMKIVGGDPLPNIRRTVMFFPMDRRQARRVARKTGHRFKYRDRQLVWVRDDERDLEKIWPKYV